VTRHVHFAWEFGAGLGHVARLRPIAAALQERGFRISFGLRQTGATGALPSDWPVWAAAVPGAAAVPDRLREPATFADILYNDGLTVTAERRGAIRAWRTLYDTLQPDLLVCDFAPYALLASQGLRMPRVLLGTGFACPPDQVPLPDLRAWQDHYPERLRRTEAEVTAALNAQLEAQGEAPVRGVGELYARADAHLLTTFAELDHYPERPAATPPDYRGIWSDLGGASPAWPDGDGRRVFAYLKPFRGLSRLLDQLEASGAAVVVFTRAPLDPSRWRRGTLRLTSEPVAMDAALADCDLAICHGGHGTVGSALLAGVPLLVLPFNVEQYHTGERVQSLGAGRSATLDDPGGIEEALAALLAGGATREQARRFAARYRDFDSAAALEGVVATLADLAGGT
jgi:UDP:flavonoid glycosyltransferase YjiC (YdhE family)